MVSLNSEEYEQAMLINVDLEEIINSLRVPGKVKQQK
ncbi:hypothetical protein cce_3270 [Crocosphaera subtropica ATCC 51142]|uniref:Uncharacterized protein n=1 Tax=Crocosphaera subtropica (strain ATCC 51142 / BH68) TaxID=43989 RepID=B1WY34_CROS5|nr:hypothetical protein cce_3270 [Crocosphaera subtropica ATCC 51142]